MESVSQVAVLSPLGSHTHLSELNSVGSCAARIGQTFSDATDTIQIDSQDIMVIPDASRVDRHGTKRTFTDGVGKISSGLLNDVWNVFARTRKQQATLLQIRFQGAKGMLALDTQLEGKALCLRPSMIKFQGSASQSLEICGAGYKRLPMYLNRQFIKILEDLGVPAQPFLDLQKSAVQRIRDITLSPINAARYLEVNFVTTSPQTPQLILALHDMGLNFYDDEFLRDIVDMTALVQLREIKYRARIPVDKGHTLYGVVDETEFLKSREIYAAIRHPDRHTQVLIGDLIITRAPALHPGDMQFVRAVDVPCNSPLNNLHNCVVFSKQGDRDLPSMLSGGDLDGDLYNLIFDQSLWPKTMTFFEPADYPRPEPINIGRNVETKDMTDFFLLFMESDSLGYISNAHVQVADQKWNGTLSDECIMLAEMASTAVDFAKTGIPVDMKKFPTNYNKKCKPDFMAKAPRLLIEQGLTIKDVVDDEDEGDDDEISALDPDTRRVRFYPSTKALGYLYRAIDDQRMLRHLGKPSDKAHTTSGHSIMDSMWDHVQRQTPLIHWEHLKAQARRIRDSYVENVIEIAYEYSLDARNPLTELEVFSGIILGKDGGFPNKRVRESNISMKERFNRDVSFTTDCMLRGEPGQNDTTVLAGIEEEEDSYTVNESSERSLACLAVAMEEGTPTVRRFGKSISFRYLAAAVCLKELERSKRPAT